MDLDNNGQSRDHWEMEKSFEFDREEPKYKNNFTPWKRKNHLHVQGAIPRVWRQPAMKPSADPQNFPLAPRITACVDTSISRVLTLTS